MVKVCLDAGHGGKDPGAVGHGRKEKDDVLRLTKKVGEILKKKGVNIFYTRTTDIYESPSEKASQANKSGAYFFASFHRNSATASANGYETLVYNNSGKAKICADAANKKMEGVGFRNRGTKIRRDLTVLNKTTMPAVLFEVGFITNAGDNKIFVNKIDAIAKKLAKAICKAVGVDFDDDDDDSHSVSSSEYYKAFDSKSIIDGLKSISVDSSFASRKKIAAANGLSDYSGTASQNTKLLDLARKGKLKKK